MDASGLGGQFLSSPVGGLLDLESPIHRQQQAQSGHSSLAHQRHMNLISGLGNDHQPIGLMEVKGSSPRNYSTNLSKGKGVSHFSPTNDGNVSEDDEPSFTEDGNGDNSSGAKSKKGSPWQRMKWTDNVVRLLIAVVACVGDDGAFDGVEGLKRKSGILQKKGKWKTVSKILISKGCHVSPQQSEDKFNDLNKRYKRLNDILGRGTSCRVVENPALMDSMPLSAKAKEDVRKILSSKHLFYKEMCAYHNGQMIPNCQDLDLQGFSLPLERCSRDNNGSEEEEAEGHDDSDEDESDNEDDNNAIEEGERMGMYAERNKVNEEDAHLWPQSGGCNSFEVEMAGIFQDPSVSLWEKKEWINKQKLQLLEQRVSIQAQAFELEKQRFKWLRYCSKKDKEFEKLRLENERMRLENEQSVLQLRQKQLEMDLRSSESSRDPTSLGIDRLQGRDQIDLGRHQ
ncbi:transcription factor, putative [Ricinus communis]|uniref:Transcription factor, putative n=1 Tax=Ricinus communis TaxID=3988 RepID=B9RIA5_RICCO|nr:transcription factor, putative [Ricinus communis]|eukprot:XP_025012151.1 uncharacterized protein LOC8274425 [Ricinus communis]